VFILINIYLILTIIRPQDYIPAFEVVRILPIVLFAAFLAWLFKPNKDFSAPQFLLLGLFLLVAMVSEVASGWSGGALQVLAIFGPVVLTFAILANAVTTRRRTIVVMEILTVCAAVLALHGVLQVVSGIGWTGKPLVEDGRIQYVGIFSDPNDLGLLFVSVLPMAFYLSSRGGWLRLFWLAVAALLLYGTYLTVSRGAVLAIAAIVVVYVWRRFGLMVAGLCGIAGIGGILMLPSRLSEMSADESSAAGRVDAWYSGLQMFMENPLLGVGPGNFTEHNDLAAHNSLVLVLAETGIVGYVLWVAFVGYCYWMVYSAANHAGSDLDNESGWREWRQIFATLLLSLVGWSVAAFFLSRSYVITLYLLTGLIVGAYAAARVQVPSLRQFHLSNDLVRWPAISLVSIVALYVMVKVLL
jgi:putative inorganic carbon (HCO3(-)) transporter